ncbi:MAG: SH3 domain-containing protein [Clostridia bacterium]|nr:SH3 domain-containing protein [Clostridia bacterium]
MKKLTAFLVMVIMLLSVCSLNAFAYDKELLSSITANYDSALSIAGRRSFYGNCNLATAYQLRAMGIYKGGLDYSGSGNLWYNHFKNESKTSGGYNVVTISGANCLYDLVSQYGNEIYNVVYCLGTGGTSGSTHVLYIRAIIDGYVYFADSFGITYDRTYYPEGTGTVLSLERFMSSYKKMNGNAYGCVYFTNGKTEHLAGSVENPDDWENSDTVYIPGKYIVTASMLRIREKPNTTSDSLDLIPNGETVLVTEIKDNWGKVEWGGKTGWICLTYTLRLSTPLSVTSLSADRPAVFSDNAITWTALAQGGTSSKYFYSFYVYKDDVKIYSGTFSTANTISFTPDSKGTYKASVTVMDTGNNTAEFIGEDVICVGDEINFVRGDTDGDGIVTAKDARIALRVSAMMEYITGRNFVCADIDKNGKVNSSDARKILRKASRLEDI